MPPTKPSKSSGATPTFINGKAGYRLKVKGQLVVDAAQGGVFGIIYGQALRSLVMPNGGISTADYRNVKFFAPGLNAGTYGGYVDLAANGGKPVGLCQVCHDNTDYWKNDGSKTSHNANIVCSDCHDVLKGLGGGTSHRIFIGDYLGTGCGNCHAPESGASESGHTRSCLTCHLDPKPTITTNILANDGGMSVQAALVSSGYSFTPRLTDSNGKGIGDPGFLELDCSTCHQLKRAGVLGGSHGGHSATTFGWDSNCADCHGPSSRQVAKEVHGNTCTICHDPARVAVSDYSQRIVGSSDYGIDGSAVGATAQSKCTGCHNTNTPGVVHHISKNGYAAAGNCTFCHATSGHQGNHSNLIAGYVNCITCHGNNVGSSAGAPVDPADNRIHDSCLTCHNLNTTLKTMAQVGSSRVVAMPDGGPGSNNGGGGCDKCHGEYFSSHGNITHQARVAGNVACDSCHIATAGTATGVPVNAADNKVHTDCYTCHQATGVLKGAYGKAPGLMPGGGNCTTCHGAYFPNHRINHASRVAGTDNCTGCHTGTAGNADGIPVNAADNKVHDGCSTCHDDQSNNLLKAAYGRASAMPVGGGDCNGCHGAYFVRHSNADHSAKVAMNGTCVACHNGTQGTASGMVVDPSNPMRHPACTTCHNPTNGALVGLAAGHAGGGDCLTCHTAHDTNLVHDHRVTSGLITDCTGCHPVGSAEEVDSLHGACQTCHAYDGNKLDQATVAAVIAAGKGSSGSNQNCEKCHTDNLHHATREAANNNCTVSCHPAVNHSATVVNTSPCRECHIDTAGTAAGAPVSFTDTMLHKSCRTCHVFDGQGRGILVNFTNSKGVNGIGSLPDGGTPAGKDGGGVCTVCHTVPQARLFHHSTVHTKAGECEYCHSTTGFSDWWTSVPGDNGGSSPYPTQLACVKCHVSFAGGTMTVTKFEHGKTNYSTDFARATQDSHTISRMSMGALNTYEICVGCHYTGSTKVPAGSQVKLYHAKPTWGPDYSNDRGDCGSGSGVYAPGRGTSTLGQFLIFRSSFWPQSEPYNGNQWWCEGNNYYANAYTQADNPYVRFSMIVVPYVPQNGNQGAPSGMAVPVLPSVPRQTVASPMADNIKVSSARWNGTNLHVIATTTNATGCSTLSAIYNGHSQAFSGTTTCVATFPPEVIYANSSPTLDVTTSNASGLNVVDYPILDGSNPASDVTPPVASATIASPATASLVPSAFSLSTEFIEEESAVTSCSYTTDGSTWVTGTLSGSYPLYSCSANLSGMSGALILNMRATSAGGVGTASAVTKTVDAIAPVDGTLTVTADFSKNNLSWTAATDGGSGLRTADTYDLRFLIGSTAPTCTTGASLYQGTAQTFLHTGLINGTQYSYRVCAYDNLNNVSPGATGMATPHDLTPPDAGTVNVTPGYGSFVPPAFALTTIFTDAQTPVTGCEYTTDGTWWTSGSVSGSGPSYTCTANLGALSGVLNLNMRAVSAGGLRTASAISRTVDLTAPTDGILTVSPGPAQNSLSWTAASDAQSGVRVSNSYDVRFLSGAVAPTCTSGTSIYSGTSRAYVHTGLTGGAQYSYRVCAYDNVNNVSTGATGNGTPTYVLPVLTTPTATAIGTTMATLGANITAGAPIIARGTVWGYTATPVSNQLAEGGTSTGIFTQARTGFPAGTKIFYRSYANSMAGTGYSPDGSFYTEPATQASAVNFTGVTANGMTVNWLRGSGDGVIVLMKRGGAVDADPADGNYGYTANAYFGSGSQIGSGNYVVYKGTGTSVSVSGLASGAVYYLAVYEYKGMLSTSGFNQGVNYRLAPASGSQTAVLMVPPTLTGPTATAINGTNATLGANVVSGANITARGTVWGTSAAPTGNSLAEGGVSTGVFTQARTGLPAGARIYYRGYATNGAGTGYSPDGSFYTEPASQASGVDFTSIGQTGMTVNWTRGSGDGVIVLMKQGAAVDADPSSGNYTGYTANSLFGYGTQIGSGNYVVYKGSSTSVPVTGLIGGVTYYLAVFEYQGTLDTSGVNQGTNYKPLPAVGNWQTNLTGGVTWNTFDYTGSIQTMTIPAGAVNIQFVLKGAGGGGGRVDSVGNQAPGLNGHLVTMAYAVTDITLRIYVAGGGREGVADPSGAPGGWGYHAGDYGWYGEDNSYDCDYDWAYGGGGGGGSSAILVDSNGALLAEAAGGAGGRSSDRYGDCYYTNSGGEGGAGGGGSP